MEIKDRVALDDNRFIMWVTGDDTPKLVTLSRSPSEVIEEGTPINKELMQPWEDSLDVIDISSSFCTIVQDENFVDETDITVKKASNVISGNIVLNNASNIGFLEYFRLKIDEKYLPSHRIILPAMTLRKGEDSYRIDDAYAIFSDDEINILWKADPIDIISLQFSFCYIINRE